MSQRGIQSHPILLKIKDLKEILSHDYAFDLCNNLNMMCLVFFVCIFWSKLLQIRVLVKWLKYECKMYEREIREKNLGRARAENGAPVTICPNYGLGIPLNYHRSDELEGWRRRKQAHKHINTHTHCMRSQPSIDLHRVFTAGSVPNCKQRLWK